MPASCYLCFSKPHQVSLHGFPKNQEICNLWKKICGLNIFDDVSRCFLCSKHFTPLDYADPNAKQFGGRLCLKPNRFPTVKVPNPITFAVSSTSSEPAMAFPNPIVAIHPVPPASPEPTISTIPTDTMCTPKKRKFAEPRYVGEITSSDFATPKRARRTWHLAKEHIISQKKKYRILDHKNRRLTKKVATLQDMLNRLRQINSLSEDAADTLMGTDSSSDSTETQGTIRNTEKESEESEIEEGNTIDDPESQEIESIYIKQEATEIDDSPLHEANQENRLTQSQGIKTTERKDSVKFKTYDEEALSIRRTVFKRNEQSERDEFQVYGELITHKIRNLRTEYSKATVQHLIHNILYDAQIGKYDFPPQTQAPVVLASVPSSSDQN